MKKNASFWSGLWLMAVGVGLMGNGKFGSLLGLALTMIGAAVGYFGDELEKDSTPATTAEWMKELRDGEAMTVEEARQKRICRICHGPDDAPFTYNYGKEYAHTKCLEMEKGGQ